MEQPAEDRQPGAHGSSGGSSPAGRRQRAGFSVFVDQVVDDAGRMRSETRLYHNESGAEATFPGASPEAWIGWILERSRATDTAADATSALGPSRVYVDISSVEILDVSIDADDTPADGSLHTVRAHLVVQLTGVSQLEREIGSRVLDGITRPRRPARPE